MECPVCESPAEDVTPGGFDGRIIRCSVDGDFEIAGTVERRLAGLDLEGRKAALAKARRFAAPGQRPTITSTSF